MNKQTAIAIATIERSHIARFAPAGSDLANTAATGTDAAVLFAAALACDAVLARCSRVDRLRYIADGEKCRAAGRALFA